MDNSLTFDVSFNDVVAMYKGIESIEFRDGKIIITKANGDIEEISSLSLSGNISSGQTISAKNLNASNNATVTKTLSAKNISVTEDIAAATAQIANKLAVGSGAQANENNSTATGYNVTADGLSSHAEGNGTIAAGNYSHAEGSLSVAYGTNSHVEGGSSVAVSTNCHVFGNMNVPGNMEDAAEWSPTKDYTANYPVKHDGQYYVCGYNGSTAKATFDPNEWIECGTNLSLIEIVGNGRGNVRKNARALDREGNEYIQGDIYINCDNDSTGGKKVATNEYIEKWMDYVPISISLFSFVSPENGLAELGSSINSVTLKSTLTGNQPVYSVTINDVEYPDYTGGNVIINYPEQGGSWTSTTPNKKIPFKMIATDLRPDLKPTPNPVTKTINMTFVNRIYWGVASRQNPDSVDNAFVTSLENKVLSASKVSSITVDALSGQYIWYALPTRLGKCVFKKDESFPGGFTLVTDSLSVSNSFNFSEQYRVYRSDNPGLGNQRILVS